MVDSGMCEKGRDIFLSNYESHDRNKTLCVIKRAAHV